MLHRAFGSQKFEFDCAGGEKKRNEILQLAVLEADVIILDEVDSGHPLSSHLQAVSFPVCVVHLCDCCKAYSGCHA